MLGIVPLLMERLSMWHSGSDIWVAQSFNNPGGSSSSPVALFLHRLSHSRQSLLCHSQNEWVREGLIGIYQILVPQTLELLFHEFVQTTIFPWPSLVWTMFLYALDNVITVDVSYFGIELCPWLNTFISALDPSSTMVQIPHCICLN